MVDEEVSRMWGWAADLLALNDIGALSGWNESKIYGPVVQGFEAHAVHRVTMRERAHILQSAVRTRLEAAATISRGEYEAGLTHLRDCRSRARDELGTVDVIALPTVPVVAPAIGTKNVTLGTETVSVREALLRNTRAANFSGLPALSIPVATPGGLPAGLQLVGRDEHTVLRAGYQVLDALGVSPERRFGLESNVTPVQPVWSSNAPGEPRCTL
ncbi:amidase family protein [Rhodococcus wratislaviensis]